jgi:CheY-like chemotaxis protein
MIPYRSVFSRRLSDKMRHEVLVARDGREGWELYRQHDIPLVITDWFMPHISRIELCQAIRARRDTSAASW